MRNAQCGMGAGGVAVVGTWLRETGCSPSVYTLAADGTYVEMVLGHWQRGTWTLRDGRLTLTTGAAGDAGGRVSEWDILCRGDEDVLDLVGRDGFPPGMLPVAEPLVRRQWKRIPADAKYLPPTS